jgi:hypothetical protein
VEGLVAEAIDASLATEGEKYMNKYEYSYEYGTTQEAATACDAWSQPTTYGGL